MNTNRWVIGSLAVLSLLVFLVLRQIFGVVWDVFEFPFYEEWVLSLPDILSLLGAVGLFAGFLKNGKINTFLKEVVLELSKVTWPAGKETVISAVVVIIMVGIASFIFFGFDVLWGSITQKLIVN